MSKKALDPVNIQYLASAPTTPTLNAGDMYFNTTSNSLQVYTGSAWVASSSPISFVSTAISTGTTTLTTASPRVQEWFVGSGTRTINLPLITGMTVGDSFEFYVSGTYSSGALPTIIITDSTGTSTYAQLDSTSGYGIRLIVANSGGSNFWQIWTSRFNFINSNPTMPGSITTMPKASYQLWSDNIINEARILYNTTSNSVSVAPNLDNSSSGILYLGGALASTNINAGTIGADRLQPYIKVGGAGAAGLVQTNSSGNISISSVVPPSYATQVAVSSTNYNLTNASARNQWFTGNPGGTAWNVYLPDTSTLTLGDSFTIVNLTGGLATSAIYLNGGGVINYTIAQSRTKFTCVSLTNTASAWDIAYETFLINDPINSTSYGLGAVIPAIAGKDSSSPVVFGANTSLSQVIIGPVSNQSGGGSILFGNATSTTNYSKTTLKGSYTHTAGQTTYAPLNLTGGNILNTPATGAVEFDGNEIYFTTNATHGRGGLSTLLLASNTATKSLTSATTANQPLFATPTTGALTLSGSTSYLVEAFIILNTGTTNTRTTSFSIVGGGTATFTSAAFETSYVGAVSGTLATPQNVYWTAATGGVMNATNTLASSYFRVKGIVRVNASGTVIPAITFSAAPGGTNTVGINSFITFTPIGTNTATSIGAWA